MSGRVVALLAVLVVVYEFAAVYFGSWPTITALVRARRDSWLFAAVTVAAIIAFATWAIVHLLIWSDA